MPINLGDETGKNPGHMRRQRRSIAQLCTLAFVAVVLAGCVPATTQQTADLTSSQPTSPDGQPLAPQEAFTDFPDLPIPSGAQMDIQRTFVFGGEDGWYGQTAIQTRSSTNLLFDFYKSYLGEMGWQEVTSVRSMTSVLTYKRGARVLVIQILALPLGKTEALVTVSPTQQQ